MESKRLGCLVIGDEILAGHVHESNSHWLANELKSIGVTLARVEICTDELGDIERSVRRFLYDLDLDYVITSGGLGPTPDDRTMEGIARALGVPLERDPAHVEWMRERVRFGHQLGYFNSPEPNPGILKMADLPRGAKAMPNNIGTALGAIVEAGPKPTLLFTLPGVPGEFVRMFNESIRPLLKPSTPRHIEELTLYSEESRFYEILRDLEREYPEVMIGSYPQRGHILIRATGPKDMAEAVIQRMRKAGAEYLEPGRRPKPKDAP